ncbi:proprotein convertase, P [Erythrobacter sp. KY5]|nr:proprotein convertase, P [Erythrobacter sp. KY5]
MLGKVFAGQRSFALLALVILAANLVLAVPAHAQNADIDWADAGVVSQGSLLSGTTATGSDGNTATITWSSNSVAPSTFNPAFSPTFVSYFDGTIGGAASPLLVSFDNSQFDPNDKITITITLSEAVKDLTFSLGDIDFGSFADAVEVYYDDDNSGAFTNAATNNAFWTLGTSVSRTNDATVNGWRGTAGSATAATDGNINFDFGTQNVQRIQIVYFSYTGAGDPVGQFMGISDFLYSTPGADLSLTKALVGSPPVQGGTAVWRLIATNNSNSLRTAENVVVQETFPAGFTFSSSTGDGSFNTGNNQWSVGTLAPGETATLTITGTVSAAAGSTLTNVAEIIASSVADRDSTPNNGVTSEDDYASATFTVQSGRSPGVPPVLACPAGQSVFDWDGITGWAEGSTDNTYAFASFGDVRFQLSNDGAYVNNAAFGGQSPTVTNTFEGGLVPAEDSLTLLANQANRTGEVEVVITLPRTFTGLQFTVFDVDFGTNQFADRLEVVGSNGGAPVAAQLTNGNTNFISGNVAIGDLASGSSEALGNVVVTFTGTVDTIILRYGNHSTAPADPGQQGIGIHDITVCDPFTTLNVSKVSSVIADPVNGTTNPKAIPGATIEYLITVTNTGGSATDVDTVTVWDDGPADAKLCLIDRAGGPVIFNDPSGNSDLTYSFASLASTTDDVEFSNDDGASFNYTPVDDGLGCDGAVTDFRVRPNGAFAAGGNFTLVVRFEVR